MKEFLVIASQTVYFSSVIKAENAEQAMEFAYDNPNITWDDYSHADDWQVEEARATE